MVQAYKIALASQLLYQVTMLLLAHSMKMMQVVQVVVRHIYSEQTVTHTVTVGLKSLHLHQLLAAESH